jgi:hypothetical protein
MIQESHRTLCVLFAKDKVGIYFSHPLAQTPTPFSLIHIVEMHAPVMPQSMSIVQSATQSVLVCGDSKGNLYYKTFSPAISVTEKCDPVMVAQDQAWNIGHPDPAHLATVAIAYVDGMPEPLTVSVDAAGEVKIWFVNA